MTTCSLPNASGIRCAGSSTPSVGPAGSILESCENIGSQTCSQCHLVKYCSKRCQIDHWPKHRKDCKHPYLNPAWQPAWVTENREPTFIDHGDGNGPMVAFGTTAMYLWGNVNAIDCLQIAKNEGEGGVADILTTNLKFCFAASGDIRNLVRTVNALPKEYRGQCDILINDINSVVANRNLIILFALLSDRLSPVEAAPIATDLMYSAALPSASATYFHQCVKAIYCNREWHGQKSTQGYLNTRGKGKIHILSDMKGPLDMFLSTYALSTALQSMDFIMLHPSRVDHRDRHLATLRPAHRLAFMRFRQSGVLAPFSADLSQYTEPNRLLFSAQGEWFAMDSADPMLGWDIASIYKSGKRHSVDPADIYGCLFFHVQDELHEFASRMRDCNINLHFTVLDARDLSSAISTRSVGEDFTLRCFDRIETSNLADLIGIKRVLSDWGFLLNRGNKHAALMMNFMNWPMREPDGMAMNAVVRDGKLLQRLLLQTSQAMDIDLRQAFNQGVNSSSYLCVVGALDLFYDNEAAFQRFLQNQDSDGAAKAVGLRRRSTNRIHTKRFGIDLKNQKQKVPSLSGSECYDIVTLGRSQMSMRFVEFELI